MYMKANYGMSNFMEAYLKTTDDIVNNRMFFKEKCMDIFTLINYSPIILEDIYDWLINSCFNTICFTRNGHTCFISDFFSLIQKRIEIVNRHPTNLRFDCNDNKKEKAQKSLDIINSKCFKIVGKSFKQILNDCIKNMPLDKHSDMSVYYLLAKIGTTYINKENIIKLFDRMVILEEEKKYAYSNGQFTLLEDFLVVNLIDYLKNYPEYIIPYLKHHNIEFGNYIRTSPDKFNVLSFVAMLQTNKEMYEIFSIKSCQTAILFKLANMKIEDVIKHKKYINILPIDEKHLIDNQIKKGKADVLIRYILLQDNITLERETQLLNLVAKYKKMFTEKNVQYIIDNYECKYDENKDLLNGYLLASKLR